MKSSEWALALMGATLALVWSACARVPGELPPDMRVPVNEDDLTHGHCINTCEPDYGSEPVRCEVAERGFEFFPGAPPGGVPVSTPIWDFEYTTDGGAHYLAQGMYSYTDKTSTNLVTSSTCLEQTFATDTCDPNGYEPEVGTIGRCERVQPDGTRAVEPTHALHVRGGPFHEWGGGVGRRLDDLATSAATAYVAANPSTGLKAGCSTPPTRTSADCAAVMPSPAPDAATCESLPPINPPPPNDAPWCPDSETCIDCAPGVTLNDGQQLYINYTNYYRAEVDVRGWDGISFWARRGPDSQRVMRVALSDRNTDDDLSFIMTQGGLPPRCLRAKECDCKDQERPCTEDPNVAGYFWCWNPTLDPPPSSFPDPTLYNYVQCGSTMCDADYLAYPTVPDLSFATPNNSQSPYQRSNSCARYTFPNETSGYYCYDTVNGPPPADGGVKCGDPWIYPVDLNPDWTFYAIPFTDLHQDGYAKEFGALDLQAVTAIRFLFGGGWVDYWVDDVRFYRRTDQ